MIECIGNYLWGLPFTCPHVKTTNHKLLSVHLPYPTRARVLQTNKSLFPFDTNGIIRNLDCWRSRLLVSDSMWRTTYEDGHPKRDSTHVRTHNSPSSSLWICTDQSARLQETERTVTKTNATVKSAENTSFCNYSFFFFSLTEYKPFFSTKLLSCSFSLVTSRVTVSLI